MKAWNRFCEEIRIEPRIDFGNDATTRERQTEAICDWLQFESERTYQSGTNVGNACLTSHSSFTTYLAGITRWVKDEGRKWNPTDELTVMLRVIYKKYGKGHGRKLPLLLSMVDELEKQKILSKDDEMDEQVIGVMLLTIFGLMRISEVLMLVKEDIASEDTRETIVTIRKFKNMRFFENKAARIPIYKREGKEWCHVSIIRRRKNRAERGKKIFTLTYDEYSKRLKTAIAKLGLHEKEYDTHSGRIGGVTMLWEQGAKDSEIRRMGRWTSDCWKVYIRFAKQHCEQLARQIEGSKLRASDMIGKTNLPADRRAIKIEDVSTSTRPSN